jgi:hypothetical protein
MRAGRMHPPYPYPRRINERRDAPIEYVLKRFVIDDRWENEAQPAAIADGQSQGWNTNSLTDAQYAPMNGCPRPTSLAMWWKAMPSGCRKRRAALRYWTCLNR